MADGRHFEKPKNVVFMDIITSLLKTGNKTANIVNGERSKTAKIIKGQC